MAPNTAGELTSLSRPLALLKGLISKRREGKRGEEMEGTKGRVRTMKSVKPRAHKAVLQ